MAFLLDAAGFRRLDAARAFMSPSAAESSALSAGGFRSRRRGKVQSCSSRVGPSSSSVSRTAPGTMVLCRQWTCNAGRVCHLNFSGRSTLKSPEKHEINFTDVFL